MKDTLNLVVMLTLDDKTVTDASRIFEECKHSKADCFGFKEEPLPLPEMKALFKYMKDCGKEIFLEVVAYTEDEGLRGAEMAAECKCDYLMGTVYFDSIHAFCREHGLRYMPFVGRVTQRPSVLDGTIDGIIAEANSLLQKGVFGFDLLGYRFTGDPRELNERFVREVPAPVCIAGSINSFDRLDEVKSADPWAFTIGGAFFERRFGGSFAEQIDLVCDYVDKKPGRA